MLKKKNEVWKLGRMQKNILEDIRINLKKYESKILESIEDFNYNHERYNANFTLAIGAICDEINMECFSQIIRETDKFIILDNHICCIVFPFTDAEQGLKAASNLLSEFEMKFCSQKIYIGIVNAAETSSPTKQIERLFDILKSSVENGMHNMPLDNTSF